MPSGTLDNYNALATPYRIAREVKYRSLIKVCEASDTLLTRLLPPGTPVLVLHKGINTTWAYPGGFAAVIVTGVRDFKKNQINYTVRSLLTDTEGYYNETQIQNFSDTDDKNWADQANVPAEYADYATRKLYGQNLLNSLLNMRNSQELGIYVGEDHFAKPASTQPDPNQTQVGLLTLLSK
jgi:hypothetical protein